MNPSREQYLRSIMSGESRGAFASMARLGLSLLELIYRSIVALRNAMFDWKIRKPQKLPRPVISVGNLTTGGTGKTPLVAWLAAAMRTAGCQPAILLRGYKPSASGISDEAAVYDRLLNTGDAARIPVLVGASRYATGTEALASQPQITHFLMDDGFQHRQLHRDQDLLVIDATEPFGYRHVLPRGMLREPMKGLARADQVIFTRCEQVNEEQLAFIETEVRTINSRATIWRVNAKLVGVSFDGKSWNDLETLRGRKAMVFCGIGNPQSFFDALLPVEIVRSRALADHADYPAALWDELQQQARQAGAEILLTTEKDAVKIVHRDSDLPLGVIRQELSIERGEELVKQLLEKIGK